LERVYSDDYVDVDVDDDDDDDDSGGDGRLMIF
jgi:hypothetical protein